MKKAIEILQTILDRVRAALAQRRRGTGTEEFEGVVLRVDQFAASEAKRLHSEGLPSMVAHIAADLSAKVTLLIKDMVARFNLFAESETKRLHSEGMQLLAVRIVSGPFDEVTKQIKDLIVASAPAPVFGNIAPAPGVAILIQNSLRGALGHEKPAIRGREV